MLSTQRQITDVFSTILLLHINQTNKQPESSALYIVLFGSRHWSSPSARLSCHCGRETVCPSVCTWAIDMHRLMIHLFDL